MEEEESRQEPEVFAEETPAPGEGHDADSGGQGQEKGLLKKGGSLLKRLSLSGLRAKWVWRSAVALIVVGLGIVGVQKWMAPAGDKAGPVRSSPESREERLSPFFIPLPGASPNQVAIISFSAVWDGPASVRYPHRELEIRDRLYRYLSAAAEKGSELEKGASLLEEEMGKVFRELLGAPEVAIKIKEIRVL